MNVNINNYLITNSKHLHNLNLKVKNMASNIHIIIKFLQYFRHQTIMNTDQIMGHTLEYQPTQSLKYFNSKLKNHQ
jgi:hypothetical protein